MPLMSPHVVNLEPQEAVAVHGEVPFAELPAFFERAFRQAAEAARAAGVEIVGPPFGFYPHMPTDTVAVEAGFPVSAPAEPSGGPAHHIVLPGGRAIEALHVGTFDALGQSYGELAAWMADEGLKPAAGMWESYLSDPQDQPDPATWQTRIVWPIS
ncbi:MAG TPA: GyrI-like domain-containing protein [Nocardioides sp.]|nr:GyrI-like domain-containing protein [Nocardioides sp.]